MHFPLVCVVLGGALGYGAVRCGAVARASCNLCGCSLRIYSRRSVRYYSMIDITGLSLSLSLSPLVSINVSPGKEGKGKGKRRKLGHQEKNGPTDRSFVRSFSSSSLQQKRFALRNRLRFTEVRIE
jgi:hypothetical protein